MPSTPQDLTRVTVNLTRAAVNALDELRKRLGYPRTDLINRALPIYLLVQDLIDENGGYFTVVRKDGSAERIHIL